MLDQRLYIRVISIVLIIHINLLEESKKSLPPCPDHNKKPHSKNGWYIMSGQGDSVKDPHPNKK